MKKSNPKKESSLVTSLRRRRVENAGGSRLLRHRNLDLNLSISKGSFHALVDREMRLPVSPSEGYSGISQLAYTDDMTSLSTLYQKLQIRLSPSSCLASESKDELSNQESETPQVMCSSSQVANFEGSHATLTSSCAEIQSRDDKDERQRTHPFDSSRVSPRNRRIEKDLQKISKQTCIEQVETSFLGFGTYKLPFDCKHLPATLPGMNSAITNAAVSESYFLQSQFSMSRQLQCPMPGCFDNLATTSTIITSERTAQVPADEFRRRFAYGHSRPGPSTPVGEIDWSKENAEFPFEFKRLTEILEPLSDNLNQVSICSSLTGLSETEADVTNEICSQRLYLEDMNFITDSEEDPLSQERTTLPGLHLDMIWIVDRQQEVNTIDMWKRRLQLDPLGRCHKVIFHEYSGAVVSEHRTLSLIMRELSYWVEDSQQKKHVHNAKIIFYHVRQGYEGFGPKNESTIDESVSLPWPDILKAKSSRVKQFVETINKVEQRKVFDIHCLHEAVPEVGGNMCEQSRAATGERQHLAFQPRRPWTSSGHGPRSRRAWTNSRRMPRSRQGFTDNEKVA